ncbi:GbpC/Spa domain-containing protein [Streptococcus suis]
MNSINFQNDPTKTLYYWIDGQETVINMDVKFYDATDKILNTSGSLLSFASLNTAIVDLDYEAISNFIGEFIEITGSGIKVIDGVARAIVSNRYTEEGSKFFEAEWDYDGSPLEYYGAIVGRTTSETINFDISSKGRNYVWFAFNTNVKAPVLPPLPPYKQITPEQEKEVPTKPVEPTYVTPTLVTFTPEVFVPEKYNPEPFVPEVFTPETFDPITPKMIPRVEVPEKETYSVSVHPVIVKQTPANIKAVVNEDGVDVNGKLVPKGSTQTWVLTNSPLVAGREVVTSYTMPDPLPAGFEIDREATAIKNTAWTVNYDENGKTTLSATQATLDYLNANRNQDVVVPVAYFVGRPINDGGTYKNTFTTLYYSKNKN